MELKQLISDERGVSPVIGVILMVAITVILAAVIGTFVLGLGSSVGNSQAPQATFNYQYNGWSAGGHHGVNITDQGGDSLKASTITAKVGSNKIFANGTTVNGSSSTGYTSVGWTSTKITAGDTLSAWNNSTTGTSNPFKGASKIRIIWKSSSGTSSVLSSSSTPSS